MLRVTAVRIAAAFILVALTLSLPVADAGSIGLQHIMLKGKFLVPDEDGEIIFKAGSKKLSVDLKKVYLQKHSVKKLKDLREGTEMLAFAKYTPWADGDELERMACLVAGQHYPPPHVPKSKSLPTWHKGQLHFNSNKTIAYVNGASLPTGVGRATCVIEKAKLDDFFVTKKSGKKTAKPAYVRGVYMEIERKGKKTKIFVPKVITLPARGIPGKEYKYILDPSKMYKDLSG